MVATKWICTRNQDRRDWISDISVVMQETYILKALNHDIDIPFVVQ